MRILSCYDNMSLFKFFTKLMYLNLNNTINMLFRSNKVTLLTELIVALSNHTQ